MCDRIGRRLREEQPVESAVDDIAQGTGHNQRQADDDPLGGVFAFVDEVVHQPADDPDHHDPENPEQEFPPVEPAFGGDVHPEGRAVISMKRNWNQSGKTTIDSSRCMWVLTQILSA